MNVRVNRLGRSCLATLFAAFPDMFGGDFRFFRKKTRFLSEEKQVFFEGKRRFPGFPGVMGLSGNVE